MAGPLEAPAWPSYEIGPHDSVFALGVASVNYVKLEFALGGVSANVIGLTNELTWALLPKIGNDVRVALLEQALCGRDWPHDRKELISHFIEAFKILAETGSKTDLWPYKPPLPRKLDYKSGSVISARSSQRRRKQ
jgi:hypothetical protein